QIFMRARERGRRIEFAPIFPDDLAAGPVWFLNALHGISPVTHIHVGDTDLTPPRHSEETEWISWWWAQFGAHAEICEHPDLSALACFNAQTQWTCLPDNLIVTEEVSMIDPSNPNGMP